MMANDTVTGFAVPAVGNFFGHHYNMVMLKDGKCVCDKVYGTRDRAEDKMYHLMHKYDIVLSEAYKDKHDRTYKCTDGYEFHINRDC